MDDDLIEDYYSEYEPHFSSHNYEHQESIDKIELYGKGKGMMLMQPEQDKSQEQGLNKPTNNNKYHYEDECDGYEII